MDDLIEQLRDLVDKIEDARERQCHRNFDLFFLLHRVLREDLTFGRDYHNGTKRDGLTTLVVTHETMRHLEELSGPRRPQSIEPNPSEEA